MRQYIEYQEEERVSFAREAAKFFEENIAAVTYSKNGPQAGEYMAFRWGGLADCVLVFKVHDYEEIVNHCQFIDAAKAEKYLEYARAGNSAIKGIK